MRIVDQIKVGKLQHDFNRETASALSLGKINKYEYLAGEETFPSNEQQIKNKLNLRILIWEKLLKNK